MSLRDLPNLRRWVWWGLKEAGKPGYRKNFELAPKTVNGNTTVSFVFVVFMAYFCRSSIEQSQCIIIVCWGYEKCAMKQISQFK